MTFYTFCQKILSPLVKIIFRLEVQNQEEVPESGPVILIANHKSYLDPIVLGAALKRQIYFMAKRELFDIPLFGSLIKALGAFPVERNSFDRKAFQKALKLIRENKVVGIFPEGTRVRKAEIGEIKPGAYLIARISKAPITLACIRGVFPLFRRDGIFPEMPKVVIKFKFLGTLDENISRKEYLYLIRKELNRLWEEISL